jgi:TPP-dependent indolepyruvate ferredoxin oxidoreductase alpha subunit
VAQAARRDAAAAADVEAWATRARRDGQGFMGGLRGAPGAQIFDTLLRSRELTSEIEERSREGAGARGKFDTVG